MNSDGATLSLLAQARSFAAKLVAIDVLASEGRYEAAFGRCRSGLLFSAALALPGEHDSRFRVVLLDWRGPSLPSDPHRKARASS